MPSEQLTRQVRTNLEHDRDDLRRRVEALGSEDSDLSFDENFADSGQVQAEQNEQQTLAASLREQLDDVERALARMDDGTYGTCEVCGTAINDARLEAMPATSLCIDHA